METETLEKKIAKLPDTFKLRVERFVHALLLMNLQSQYQLGEDDAAYGTLKLKRNLER